MALKVFKKAMNSVPTGKTALEILEWLSSISLPVTNEVTLGGTGITLNSSYTSAAKMALEPGPAYVLDKYTSALDQKGHSIIMQVDLSRTVNSNEATTGVIRISYEVYQDLYVKKESNQKQKSFLYSNLTFEYND